MRSTALLMAVSAGFLGVALPARSDNPVVVVTPGSARSFKVAAQSFADRSLTPDPGRVKRLRAELGRALEFSSVFEMLSPKAFLGPDATVSMSDDRVVCSDWTQIGADALVQGEIRADSDLRVEFQVWDTTRCKPVASKRYRLPAGSDVSLLARRIADDIVEAFIGLRGVASTEIAFVSKRTGAAEIFVMGAEGSHQRPATSNNPSLPRHKSAPTHRRNTPVGPRRIRRGIRS